eukprot:4900663-Pleurochrysis_carterae.AAC.1
MWLAGIVAPVHVVPRAVADGDAGRASSVAIARKAIVVRASEEVTELVGIEVWTRSRGARPRDCARRRSNARAKVSRKSSGASFFTRRSAKRAS